MSIKQSYPHFVINVDDKSGSDDIAVEESLGLHIPLFFGKFAKGTPNVPIWCQDTNAVKRIFGEEVFDNATPYFTHETAFLETNFKYQGGFITRLMPDDASTATCHISCEVTEGVDVPQYKRDEFGGIIKDEDSKPIPIIDSDTGLPVTAKGIKLVYKSRQIDLLTEPNVKDILPITVDNNGTTSTTYPIGSVIANNVGDSGNNLGFRLFYNKQEQQFDRIEQMKALEYTFVPVEKNYSDSTASVLRNRWSNTYVTFMLKPGQYDTKVMQNISYAEVIANNYVTGAKSELPMSVYMHEKYIKLIGELICGVETNDTNLTDPYMADILTGMNLDGYAYHNVIVEHQNVFFNNNYTIYLKGGSDGTNDQATYQELIRKFMKGDFYPRVKDKFMFPITHLYDTGYATKTKEALISFAGVRDDVRIEIACQDVFNELNDESEDQSIGTYLRTRALLQVESISKGTQCFRCSVYAHAGRLDDNRFTSNIPCLLDILDKRCKYQSTTLIKGEPKMRPNSEITMFKTINWTAFDEDNKALFWDSGINYIQHWSRKGMFWPDLRTVHPIESSVLTEWTFADALVYTKHFIASAWTKFTGNTKPFIDISPMVQDDVNKRIKDAFGDLYPVTVLVWRSLEDAKRGYIYRVRISLTGRTTQRVWESEIITYKDETYTEGVVQ